MWRSGSVIALTIGVASNQAPAAIFDRDDRQYVSTAPGSPYSPIGIVSRGSLGEYRTTGVLVDECDVLTSQHVLGYGKSPLGKRLKFIGARGTPERVSSMGTVIAVGGLERIHSPAEQFEVRGRDWLLLRLDKCLGVSLGYAVLKTGPFSTGEFRNLQSAGYPGGRSSHTGLTLDPSCRFTGSKGGVWLNDCASMPGNSGGPIFRISGSRSKPQMEVYAIQSAGYAWAAPVPFAAGYDNQATPVDSIARQIAPYLRASGDH